MIVVTAAIIEKDGKILAARRAQGKHLASYWEFPGGKIDDGESPEACLARELMEEFEVETTVGPLFDTNTHDYQSKRIKLLAFQVKHKQGEFKLIDHDKILWLEPAALRQLDWAPADIPIVSNYQAYRATRDYYRTNAKSYCEETVNLDMDEPRLEFQSYLEKGSTVLDVGCGSGRDSKNFIDAGFRVTAIDNCPEVASIAGQYIEQSVQVGTLIDIDHTERFDGVWANASLLHCSEGELLQSIENAVAVMAKGGIMYMSFKNGTGYSVDNSGRFFNNKTIESLSRLLDKTKGIQVIRVWGNASELRGATQTWVQALVRKEPQPE